MSKVIVGIDPGKTGGIAVFDGKFIRVYPMPVVDMPKTKSHRGKKILNEIHIRDILAEVPLDGQVFIENVHGGLFRRDSEDEEGKNKAKAGAASMFNFGKDCGKIEGICVGLYLSRVPVSPQTWKAEVLRGLDWRQNKRASIAYVQGRYPQVNLLPSPRHRVESHGMADAVCIAEYGRARGMLE